MASDKHQSFNADGSEILLGVVELDEIQVLAVSVVLDSTCFGLSIQPATPVPVLGHYGGVIGHASLRSEGERLVADINLRWDCPERLSIETGSPRLYAEPVYTGDWGSRVLTVEEIDVVMAPTRATSEPITRGSL